MRMFYSVFGSQPGVNKNMDRVKNPKVMNTESCDCYRIGGPFITFDPACPTHGLEAQAKEREREKEEAAREKK